LNVKRHRLDQELVARGLIATRSQAESHIKLGYVKVNGHIELKPELYVTNDSKIKLTTTNNYVSRAALKLASISEKFQLHFKDQVVLDVGSSTGGFTDYALQHDARKVIAVEIGTDQLHPSLRSNPLIELHEQTDIRNIDELSEAIDIIVIDVSFVSLRDILPHIAKLSSDKTIIVAMVKPQFEVGAADQKHQGVIKNDRLRRDILKAFEEWSHKYFIIDEKADSTIAGAKGNVERFYKLRKP
jgi:23S rRNA (cytidine1920-2'-O)/16S rRNA (cytidine1409-2'-O)-methyltransferase